MFRPRILKKGDTVGLLAPSGCVLGERITPAVNAVKKMGFNVKLGKTCYARHGYFAGTDDERANDINEMFADKAVDGIFAMRGGYGAQRLLHKLDYKTIAKNAKTFAGYSDITALHIVFNQKCGFVTYHSPMPSTQFYKDVDEYTVTSFMNNITQPKRPGKIENPKKMPIKILKQGIAEGIITGGNLSLLATSIGTPYEIDTRNKIIFIEEIGEEPYKIDRMLTQLKLAGKFAACAGMVFGAFTDCNAADADKSLTINEILDELILPEGKPAIYNVACGHSLPTLTIPMGSRARISGDKLFFL